ncbi:MAG: hypothetical protein L0338_34495 [Acidobacteria bacterium]|nr:hypothetical protein [Verrucomicrobiales bacterium]MCI0724033.1 hypothetical protein [Acidobacteriota bacterium]
MKTAFFLITLALAFPFSASAETWKNVAIVDTMCSVKAKADPDKHTTKCALACAESGFGILAPDSSYLKFDDAGSQKVVAALKNTKKADRLRGTVTGERDGETIKVQSFSLD